MHWYSKAFMLSHYWIFIYYLLLYRGSCAHQMIARLQITHSVPISGTSDPKNTRLLYRIFGPNSTEYILVAGLNHIYQYDAHTLRSLSVRTTGRKNFSIFCSPSGVCGPCDHSDQTLFRMGYKPGDCGPRETDSVVKAWATSTVPESEVPRIPESYVFYQRGPGESVLINDDRIACENALYVCHNLYHGFCERLSLTNIREASPWTPSFTNPFEPSPEESDKVPVTGSDPIKHVALAVGLRYVYVATEPDKLPQYTLVKTYPISVRSRDFQFAHRQPAPECILRLTETIPVPIQYKRAFRYRAHLSTVGNKPHSLPPAHIYFVFQQPESPQFNRWQPRISRVCDNDMRFFSHVELNLACKDCTPAYYTQETFNALHTAARGTVGQLLAWKLQTQQDSQLTEDHTEGLVVAFAAQHVDSQYHRAFAPQSNDPYHTRGSSNFGSGAVMLNGSVISIFSMAQVDAQFKYVIDKCLSGDGVFGPAHFLTTRERVHGQCVKDETEKAEKYYCPKDRPRNRLIMGSDRDDALEAPAFLHIHENVVDLAVTAVSEQFTVVLLATDDGRLLEYEVTDVSQSRRLDALQLDPDRRPVTSVALDITGTIAYATTQEKVVRVNLANCDVHLTCAACIKARDPFCGWCVIEGRCLPLAECRSLGENRTRHAESTKPRNNRCSPNVNTPRTATPESTSAFTWLAYSASIDRCPVIKQLSPTGVQRMDSSSSPLDETFNQHTIMLKLDGDLARDLHRLWPPTIRDSLSAEKLQLSCAFRGAPTSMLDSTALLTGSLLQSEVNELLVGVVPTGRLLGKTSAKFILSEPDASEVQCFSLPLSKLPAVPKGQASVPIVLWLEWVDSTGHPSEAHWPALAPGMFAVYDCRRLNDCRQCSQSLFGCAWCLLDDQCVSAVGMPQGTHSPAFCPGSSLTAGGDDSTVVVMSTTGPKCPSFKSEEGQLTLLSGSTLSAKFRVHNIRQPLKHFSCLDGCTNQRVIASYDASESTVICHIEKIVLDTRLGSMHEQFPGSAISRSDAVTHCNLDIFWHGQDSRSEEGHRMVNEDNVSVEVYTCEWLAEFCDVCLTLPPRFGCGWCVGSHYSMCSTRNQCLDQSNSPILLSSPSPRSWLHLDDVCPDPQITSISPLNGTLTGRTVLHIEGRNLGRGFGDLAGGIYLQTPRSVPCAILSASYNHSRAFDCRLSSADYLTLPASGRLKVVISEHRFQALSPVFRFLKPEITEVSPTRGPIAGGTRLRLTGKNLNVGAKRFVYLERNKNGVDEKNGEPLELSLPCDIERESDQVITCRTRPLPLTVVESMNDRNGAWRFENRQHFGNFVDGEEEEEEADEGHFPMSIQLHNDMTVTNPSTPVKFIYSPNPHIDAVERENVLASAGTSIRVKGKFLFVIETPRIVFYFNWSEHSSPCMYRQDEGLNCISPTIGRHLEVSRFDIDPGRLQLSGLFGNPNSSTLLSFPQTATVRTNASTELLSDVELNLRKTAMQSLRKSTTEWPSRLAFGFVLDGVNQLRVYGSLQVLPDPVVHPFPGGIRHEELDDFTSVKNPDIAEGEQRKVMPKRSTQESSASTNGSQMDGDNEKTRTPQSHQLLRLHGQFESLVRAPELAAPEELSVRLGNSHICFVSSVIASEIRCDLDRASLISGRNYPVVVQFGHFLIYHPGVVRFVSMGRIALRNQLIMISSGVIVFLILIGLIVFTIWRRFDQRQRNYQAKLDQKYAEHENRVVRVFKEEFMELQTSMLEFSQGVKKHNLPYRDYRTFCLFSLFPEYHCELMLPVDPCSFGARKTAKPSTVGNQSPGMTRKEGDATSVPTHPLLSQFTVLEESHDAVSKGIALFHALICNRFFLSLMVRVIEENEHIGVQDRSRVASLLCAALQPKMEYLTRIMCDLMSDMLQRLHNQGNNRLPTAFRRAEAIVDKLVSNWLSFLLYNFIKNSVGEHLFYFYRALLHQLNTGPRDAVTGRARYTLDSSMLLPIELTGTLVTLTLEDPQSLFSLCSTQITVKVLDCDTITQAKEKILDAIYKNRPYSQQWKPTQLDLAETLHPDGLILCDWDVSIRHDTQSYGSEKRPFRLNCIHDYELPDNARVALILSPYHRAKSLVTSMVSLRSPSLQTFRGKKSLQSSNPPVPHNLVSTTCSPEQTLLSDPTLVDTRPEAACAPLEQPTGTCGEYSRSLSCFSAPGHGSSHYPKSSSTVPPQPNHCLRPTGHPDSALWYHLEFTGISHTLETGVNNGTIGSGQRYPYSSSTTVHPLLTTSCPEDRTTRCAKRLRCRCAKKAEEPEATPSHFGRPTKLSWSTALQFLHKDSLAHSRRMVMHETSENTADYPLLHQSDGFTRDDLIESVKYETLTVTDSRSLSPGSHHKRRGRRKQQHSKDPLKSRQVPGALDRPMESLPKEVFFNRLVVTRLSVTTFMDKLFEVIFSSVLQSHSLPSPIKYLFDFLDSQAVNLGVQDPKIVHAWNLQMRFWNQIITNLDYIFDIPLLRRTAFERSFHALSQAMTYACAPTKEKLTPDSSSVKLLFARDISQQWTRVNNYYREIKAMPAIKREDMQDILRQHSVNHSNEFNVSWAIYELYMKYVKPCQASIVNQLQQEALKTHFPYKSQMVYDAKPASLNEEISPVDDFDFSEYNPIQLIQMLTEVERCMNDAQASTLLVRESMTTSNDFLAPSFHHAEASSPDPTYTNELSKHRSHPLSNSTVGPGLPRNVLSSAPSGDTTEYPDTLRSLNTLTTEFAGDETNRSAPAVSLQQSQPYHHCYHMYGTNEPVLSSPIHTTSQQQQQHGSSLLSYRVPDPPA
ncbi:hypothetical protein T265_07647 [Opisthorchis viverrini]|uniref:Sema domain-containing protein n=1 Tax=Opisthorchis viverrini TaxID=6198 RepID=A0A074ZBT8_OPIVI|nr:hypothetical protein T265_07647 [Opisthorchis viverrini]KER24761.1 hypothetical protein T265_07647 [Opisthorchis viverrini]